MAIRTPALLLLLAILLAPACSESPTEPVGPSLGEQFSLGVGESASIRSERVTISFERLASDSRCPIGGVCFWQGEAVVALSLKARGSDSSFELSTFFTPRAAVSGYEVILLGVSPNPSTTVVTDPGSYRVELVVRK